MNLLHPFTGISLQSLQIKINEIEKNAESVSAKRPGEPLQSIDFLELEGSAWPQNAHHLCPRSRPESCSAPSPVSSGDLQARIERQADGNKQASALPDQSVPLQPVDEGAGTDASAGENAGQGETGTSGTTTGGNGDPLSNEADNAGSDLSAGGTSPAADGETQPPAAPPGGQADETANHGSENAQPADVNPSVANDAAAGTSDDGPAAWDVQQPGTALAEGEAQGPAPIGTGPADGPQVPENPAISVGTTAEWAFQGVEHPVFPPATLGPAAGTAPDINGDYAVATPANPATYSGPLNADGNAGFKPVTNAIPAAGEMANAAGHPGPNPVNGQAANPSLHGFLVTATEKIMAFPAAMQNALRTLLLSLLAHLPEHVLADPVKSRDAFQKIWAMVTGLAQKIAANPQQTRVPVAGIPAPQPGQGVQRAAPPRQTDPTMAWQQNLNPAAINVRWAAPFGEHEWKDDVLHIKGGKYRGCRGHYDKKKKKLRIFTKCGKHVANQHVKKEKKGRPRVSSPLAAAHAS